MAQRKIHVHHHGPRVPSAHPPLLFLHGGYVDSRCWSAHFLPWFASHGYDCYAPDLPGHGRSEGSEQLDRLGLDDYLAGVAQVIRGLDRQPVVIGHSMGAYLAERAVELSLAEAGVLMSPVPPLGTLESAANLFLSRPQFLTRVQDMTRGVFDPAGLRILRDVYFTPTTQSEVLLRLAQLVQPESTRAICDMALLGWRWLAPAPRRPMLVVGGELDAVFPPYMVRRVARRWDAELHIVAEAGHAMILDHHWKPCAAHLLDWLQRLEHHPRRTPAARTS